MLQNSTVNSLTAEVWNSLFSTFLLVDHTSRLTSQTFGSNGNQKTLKTTWRFPFSQYCWLWFEVEDWESSDGIGCQEPGGKRLACRDLIGWLQPTTAFWLVQNKNFSGNQIWGGADVTVPMVVGKGRGQHQMRLVGGFYLRVLKADWLDT